MDKIGRIDALLQKGTKIVPQRALFYRPTNGALRAPFRYRLFFSVCSMDRATYSQSVIISASINPTELNNHSNSVQTIN